MSKWWFCDGGGGHYVEGKPDFCPEHDNRIWHIVGKLAVGALLLFILLLLIGGFWVWCTATDPEYFDWCASYGCP